MLMSFDNSALVKKKKKKKEIDDQIKAIYKVLPH